METIDLLLLRLRMVLFLFVLGWVVAAVAMKPAEVGKTDLLGARPSITIND
ncbi:MAG: hypothetical protein ACYDAI_18595 [Trichloromonadaceae bacterium]